MSKRKLQRYHIFLEAAIEAKGQRIEGVTANVSPTGVCICCLSPAGVRSPVSVIFYFQDQRAGTLFESVAATVRWEKKFGRLFVVGAQFQAPLNVDDNFLILSHIELTKEYSKATV